MPNTTTTAAAILLPEQVHDLVVLPLSTASVALRVSTVSLTDSGTVRLPVVQADPSAGWVNEGQEIPITDAVISELDVTPTKLAGLSVISRELADDSAPAALDIIGAGLVRDVATRLDAAYFGDLAAPAPSGLEGLSGVAAVDAGTAYASLDPFAEAVSRAEEVGALVTTFITSPATALALAQLKEASGSARPLLGADPTQAGARSVLGVPMLVSPAVAPGVVWALPSDRVHVVRRTDVRLDVDASPYFSSDQVAVRVSLRVGFGFPHPAAVVRIATTA